MARPRKIIAECYTPIKREAVAVGVVSPGHLCVVDSAGKIKVHPTAYTQGNKYIATEDELQGKQTDQAYAIGDVVPYYTLRTGDRFYGRILNGQNVARSAYLVSAGDGTFRAYTEATTNTALEQNPIAMSLEACDMSGSSGVDPIYCLMEML